MNIRLLGTTEVVVDGAARPLGGPRQRAVLAALALHAGRALVVSELIDDLWGGSPPASAGHTIENLCVSPPSSAPRRRCARCPCGRSVQLPAQRRLRPRWTLSILASLLPWAGALDRGDAARRGGFLSAALALWRGPALADVQDSVFAPIAARRLEE